jgi:hypothetical protein
VPGGGLLAACGYGGSLKPARDKRTPTANPWCVVPCRARFRRALRGVVPAPIPQATTLTAPTARGGLPSGPPLAPHAPRGWWPP